MAAVRIVVNFRVKPGKEADLLEGIRAVKKHLDRLGESLTVVRQVSGPEPGNIVAVGQCSGWDHFAKVQSDPELAKLLQDLRSDTSPAWEAMSVAVNEEIVL
jgi:hypothetical protein